jgi:DNA-binding response OmpR family regulator
VTINEQPVVFLRRELSLLEALVGRMGRIVTRDALIDAVYGMDDEVQPQALTTLVYRLRSRLQELDSGVDLHVVRGVGYMIAAEKRNMSK